MTVIAMTREMGSLGNEVAAGCAHRMGRKVVYHEIIEPLADKMRLRKSHVERFLDGKAGLWERLTTDRASLAKYTAEETFSILRDPQTAVIRGWGPVNLLRFVPHVVRVRVCAPFEQRVRNVMERLHTTERSTVEKEIRLSDEAHGAIVRRHFGADWRDPEHYHLVLCTSNLSIETCVEQVAMLAAHKQFEETDESRQAADDLALESSVRAALYRDGRTLGLALAISCVDQIVTVTGMVPDNDAVQSVTDVAAGVAGVRRVQNHLRAASLARTQHLAET